MTEPQTREQVIAGVNLRHFLVPSDGSSIATAGRWTCNCGALLARIPSRRKALAAHQAVEVVAALGLREEWGTRLPNGLDMALKGGEREARNVRAGTPIIRHVTDWRPADGD